jgi:hypothetical protein
MFYDGDIYYYSAAGIGFTSLDYGWYKLFWTDGRDNGNGNGGTANYTLTGIGPNQVLTAGSPSHIYTGLTAGTYTLTVTDSKGLYGSTGGCINPAKFINVIGEQSGYFVQWRHGFCNTNAKWRYAGVYILRFIDDGLNVPGTYSYTVTDANTCTANTTITITQPSALVVTATVTTPIPCSGGQGVVTVSAVGGTPAYSGTGNFTVSAGTHTFTVTDAGGCTANSDNNGNPTQSIGSNSE